VTQKFLDLLDRMVKKMCQYKKNMLWTPCRSLQKIQGFRCISPDANLETEGAGIGITSVSHRCRHSTSPPETGEANGFAAYATGEPLEQGKSPVNANQHTSARFFLISAVSMK